jgi:hypothetical protein
MLLLRISPSESRVGVSLIGHSSKASTQHFLVVTSELALKEPANLQLGVEDN